MAAKKLWARFLADQIIFHELPHDRHQNPMSHDFRKEQQRTGDQQAQLRFDVQQKRQLYPVAPGASFDQGQNQQGRPGEQDQQQHAARQQFKRGAAQ